MTANRRHVPSGSAGRALLHAGQNRPPEEFLPENKKLREHAEREFGAPSRTQAGHSLQSFSGLNYHLSVTITI